MESKQLDTQVSVSAEPALEEMAALAQDGVEVIVCNRPEQEAEGQPSFAELEQAAKAEGMAFVAIPFSRGQMQPEHCKTFAELLNSGKKVHAFCRTGNRSCNLWAGARCMDGADKKELLKAAQQAGFDISGVLVTY